jgi:hypothetical protein
MSTSFTIEVQELSRFSNAYSLDVKWHTSIKDVKDQLHTKITCPASRMRLYHYSSAKQLRNNTTLHDMGIYESGHVFRLVMGECALCLSVTCNLLHLLSFISSPLLLFSS